MAYKKRFRKYNKKRFRKYYKARKGVYGKSYNYAAYKIRYLANVASDGTGIIDRVLSTSDPESAVNSAGVYNDWTDLENLWDSYKVTGLKVTFVPSVQNNTSATTAWKALYFVQDEDDVANATSVAQMLQYDRFKIRNLNQPFSMYYKVKKKNVTGNPQGWLNVGAAGGSGTNRLSGIKVYGDGFTNSTTYGQFILTMYIKCKGRR